MVLKKHFDQISKYDGWKSPLAVISHIDLDAFYAQCQGVNEDIPPEEPLGCRQWNSLIAVNYPARKYGIKRGASVDDARARCPDIHLPHVPTFKKGHKTWSIEKEPKASTHKVSLDLFRRESRKIFKIFRRNFSIVEKAGIDEGFINMGPEVHARALELYPQLSDIDPQHEMPPIPSNGLPEWRGVLPSSHGRDFKPQSWHDILIAIASEMVWDVRMQVHKELRYTCSAGISSTKITAKLGSAANKPFNQTVIPQSLVLEFLDESPLTEVWGWGGKLGKQVTEVFNVPEKNNMGFIRSISLDQLRKNLSIGTAQSLYRMVRGEETSEVSKRTTIKSMASVKNFTRDQSRSDIYDWVVVYCADLAGRIADIDDDEGVVLRPRVVSVQYHKNGTSHSKQMQAPSLAAVKTADLFDSLFDLVIKMVNDNVPMPCRYLSVELSKLEPMTTQSMFVRIDQKKLASEESYTCVKCGRRIFELERQEHEDRHFAQALQQEVNAQPGNANSSDITISNIPAQSTKRAVSERPTKKSEPKSAKRPRISDKSPTQRPLDSWFKS